MLPAPDPDDGPGRPVGAIAELAAIVLGTEPLGAVLGRVVALAVRTVPDTDEASVTLLEDGQARSVAFTGSLAVDLDERQYEQGWGPCLDAAATGERVVVDIAHAPDVYGEFARSARRAGVTSSASIGMPLADRIVGGLNLYSRTRVFDEQALALGTMFAGYAAVAVTNAARYASAEERAANMVAAMASRAVIEQAKGIVMATERCSADEAFATLVRASQSRNMKLRDVAETVVRSTLAPAEDQGTGASAS